MAKTFLAALLVRLILPASLLFSLSLRPFGLSFIYLLLYLISPHMRIPNHETINGGPGFCMLLYTVLSNMLLIVHGAWHIALAAFAPYGSLLDSYPLVRTIGENLGLVSYSGMPALTAVQYLAPELVMSPVSIIVHLTLKKLCSIKPFDGEKGQDEKIRRFPLLTSAGKYVCLLLIMASGIMYPSITSGIYFLVFMGAATAWSLGQPLERGFAVVGRCVMAIMAVHMLVLITYQCTWINELYPSQKPFARFFGLAKLVGLTVPKGEAKYFYYEHTDHFTWPVLASPLVILFTYFILALETRELFKSKPEKKDTYGNIEGTLNGFSFYEYGNLGNKEKWISATKKVRLLRSQSRSHWSSVRSRSGTRRLHQDSVGSVFVSADAESFIEREEPTLMDDIIAAVIDFFEILVRSSYIATTIIMMAWSIMFHSWLAFVFLMWANVVWLCQDQRSFMLRTSPLLVVYAMILLLMQYVYSMTLLESELPSKILAVNLQQIGLRREQGAACVPLLIKSLFTCMFWVTLRQLVEESRRRRAPAEPPGDLAAPLPLTPSNVASVHEEEKRSRLMRYIGDFLKVVCARYWIYVVVIMLCVIGITGERMTIFRIVYMFLFLGFILMFQISWYWWRRLMYVFWITVIIYSMINLILLYIYQFDNFEHIIYTYLKIDSQLQHDLGLEPFEKADLFVKLLTPTCFLIITIVQVHYFHKDFMALSHPRTRPNSFEGNSTVDNASSRHSQAGASTMRDDMPQLPTDWENAVERKDSTKSFVEERSQSLEISTQRSRYDLMRKSYRDRSNIHSVTEPRSKKKYTAWIKQRLSGIKSHVLVAVDKIFMYLHLHLIKIIFLALILLCALNVCAMHVPIVLLVIPGLLMNGRHQRCVVMFISVLISIYVMMKMIYQIQYIQPAKFDVNCTKVDGNSTQISSTTLNNAVWLGLRKVDTTLPSLLKGYIGLIALFTFHSLVRYRQQSLSGQKQSTLDDLVLFPEITRKEADIDLLHCAKYLINYGFYKFGVELTLICLMGVIGSRMDMYAVFYAFWLLLLVGLKRVTQAKFWPAFTGCITILIPIQYMIAVGLTPQLCVSYSWSGNDGINVPYRTWFFLPDPVSPPHASKIVFDFVLLLLATRQLRVFRIEKRMGATYPGGCNSEDIGNEWETPSFVNPVPDFLGVVSTWLDLIKRMVFLVMLWVTLAIMFLTGTNRVNLFSMGYLIGSFIFLWQGTDFYLRPKESILQWWSWLLGYNVMVVVVKTLLQIPGCIYATEMRLYACWLVQLLGIGCVDKFAGGNIANFLKMNPSAFKDSRCSVPQEDIGLAWDGVCFAFLILQKRLFHSYYFYRVIDESKATTVLASRGAELIEELRVKQMTLQEDQEVKILEKIKVKMERIKANQKKVQGAVTKDPPHHDTDDSEGETVAERVPLGRGESESRGYHTPDSPASPRGFHTPLSEPSAPASRAPSPAPAPAPAGPPSPSSALMTVSLDAYLEPRRISFESPPSSSLLPRAQSPEESFPVFSPPTLRRRHTLASPGPQRASIFSVSSRAEPNSHHTSRDMAYKQPSSHQKAVRSGDYYMFDEFDDTEVPLKDHDSSSDEDVPKEMGLGKLLSTAIKTDLRRAVSLRRSSMSSARARTLSAGTYSHPDQRERHRQQKQVEAEAERDDPDSSDIYSRAPAEEAFVDNLLNYWYTISAFVSSAIVTLTKYLMRFSRDYRYVSRALSMEKKILKEQEGFGIGLREGSQMIWEPLPEVRETVVHQDEMEHPDNNLLMPVVEMGRKLSDISVPEIRILAPSMERGLDASPPSRRAARSPSPPSRASSPSSDDDGTSEHESAFSLQTTESKDLTILEEQEDSMFKQDRNPCVHLAYAIFYTVVAHTDIVCYIMVFINQIQSATILSIPLPLMVFLWGTLTIPRPTKTFWVTLIAYTEVIVLLKSMFQFEILPWNQMAIPDNMPFTAPRIIGIERKSNYALYDLLLLLIIFLHRFMLKSLGLWKESSQESDLRRDMEFPLSDEDTQLIVEGDQREVGKKYLKLHDEMGPRHWLADRWRRVQHALELAAAELRTTRSDPGAARLAWELMQASPGEHRSPRLSGSKFSALREEERRKIEKQQSQPAGDPEPEAGPSNANDGDHYKVNDDHEPIIAVSTTLEDKYGNIHRVILLGVKRYLRPTQQFFKRMLAPGARVTADVYAYMFLCDFFNFLVVIFGFAAFGTHQGDGGVQAYLEENKVPIPFLVMLILQFVLIVVDRALYLRKYILGKILFQYALIIGVHVWMFFVLPSITERTFNARLPPPIWYMVKCLYLLLSAHQIRCGYPRRIIGNFLCKSYRFLNMVFFRCFMAVPFVFELRTLMDWIWTDTSMTLMDWLKMEDIFASVFLLKCSRHIEDEYPQPRGLKKSTTVKYILGGSVLAFVIAIIWFPLVFFAFGDSVGKPNPPTDVTVKIRIGPFLPVYQMSAQSHNIEVFTAQEYGQLSNQYSRDRTAQTFLSNYMYNDVAVIVINPNSTMKWEISPPELDRLEREAASNASLLIRFTFVITRPSNNAQNPPTIDDHREMPLEAYVNGTRNPERETLLQLLAGNASSDTWLNVDQLFPKFLKIFNKGIAKPAYQLIPESIAADPISRLYRNVQLRLEHDGTGVKYWRVREACTDHDALLLSIPKNTCDMLVMYTFNDKLFPETLNFISGGGIIGLYTTFVFLASRVLRGFFSGIYTKIMFDDLPNVDRVLQLCLDIYLVREALELALEEDLFAKLVFLYRSPETMIKWTRPKDEEPLALPAPP